MDSHTWDKREKRFRKKFEAGRKHIRKIFDGFETRPQIEQVALLVYASKDSHQSLGGAPIMLMPELLAQIINRVRQHELNVPEHFTFLRTIQFIAKYPEQLHAPLFGQLGEGS